MLGEAQIELRLVDPERNRDRVYLIEVDDDLFGGMTVTVTHGRRNVWTRPRRLSVPDRAAALRLVAERLKRRNTARRRLGAAYELVSATGGPELRRATVGIWQRLGGADRTGERPQGSDRAAAARQAVSPPAPPLPLFAA